MFCFYYRYLIHRKMDRHEKTSNPFLSRHLCRCTACRDYHDRIIRLGVYMKKSDCPQLSEAVLVRIESSVIKSLEAFDAVKKPKQHRPLSQTRRWTPWTAAAGFLIATGLFGWLYWTDQRDNEAAIAANKAIASLNIAAVLGDRVSLLNLLTEQPVRQEMDKLVNNAQEAVIYIANCIPQGPSNLEAVSPKTPGD